MPEAVEQDRLEVVSTNLVTFVAEIEQAINDGYEVLYDQDHFPTTHGFNYSCWLIKMRERKTRSETLELARAARNAKREDFLKEAQQ